MPDVLALEAVSPEEFQRWHLERPLHATGAATEADRSRYLTCPRFQRGARRAALRVMLEGGEVTEIEVEATRGRWLALTRDLPALARVGRATTPSVGTTLLSPFDSLLWHRDRVARLFGFDYRIEVYTPGPERVHGYYTLPILHHSHLIGRLDAKAHRVERWLEIRHVHFEPWFAEAGTSPADWGRLHQDEAPASLGEAVGSLAALEGAGPVALGPTTPPPLPPPPARTPTAPQHGTSPVALAAGREIPRELVQAFGLMPKDTDPMGVLQAAVAMLGMRDPDGTDNSHAANVRKAVRFTSQLATAICAHHRVRSGQEPGRPASDLSHAPNFVYILPGTRPTPVLAKAFDASLTLYAEHELNASTFTPRVIVSTQSH